MDTLGAAIEALKRAKAQKTAELAAIEESLEKLEGLGGQVNRDGSRSAYAGIGIVEASRQRIRTAGPQTTNQLVEALTAGGLKSRSKRIVPTVYATLKNSKDFERDRDAKVWRLRDGRPAVVSGPDQHNT